jgi:hypothetical protein
MFPQARTYATDQRDKGARRSSIDELFFQRVELERRAKQFL